MKWKIEALANSFVRGDIFYSGMVNLFPQHFTKDLITYVIQRNDGTIEGRITVKRLHKKRK